MSVNSTYNFVPAPTEAEVYKPNWSNQVSHDIPFSDGESGEIELQDNRHDTDFYPEWTLKKPGNQ